MERKLDLKVGQKVVVKIITDSNVARHRDMSLENIDEWCFDGIITKVGRKYITVKWSKWNEEQFGIEDDYRNKYNCGGADYQLYLSKEEVINERKADGLYSKIKDNFSGWKNSDFTLDQLERVMNIIDES